MNLLVVTPTLGRSPWLAETVASVAAFAGRHVHVLVAPDGVGGELRANFPQAVVVSDPGGGMYAAINAGLAARGDWDAFTYINDDDLLLPGFADIRRAARPGPCVIYGGVRLIDARGRRIGAIPISPDPALNRLLYAQRIEPVYQHGTWVSRAAVEQVGPFDATLRYCGDSEFLARACVAGIPFVRGAGRAVAAFRLRAGQLTKQRVQMTAERARVDEKLGLVASVPEPAHRAARRRFRLANAAIYAERLLRHRAVTFDDLLARVG